MRPGKVMVYIPLGTTNGPPLGLPDWLTNGCNEGNPYGAPEGTPEGTSDAVLLEMLDMTWLRSEIGPSNRLSDGSSDGTPLGTTDGPPLGLPNWLSDCCNNGNPYCVPDGTLDGTPNTVSLDSLTGHRLDPTLDLPMASIRMTIIASMGKHIRNTEWVTYRWSQMVCHHSFHK